AASRVCRCETANRPSRTASSCPRLAASARPSNPSVVPPSADTTTTGARSRSRASATIVITRLMAAASTTDEPPNFITSARMRGLLASVRAKKRPPALFEAGGRGDPWSSLSAVSEHRRPHNRPAGPLGPLSIGVVDHRAMHWRRFYYTPRQSVFNTSIGGTRSVRRAGRWQVPQVEQTRTKKKPPLPCHGRRRLSKTADEDGSVGEGRRGTAVFFVRLVDRQPRLVEQRPDLRLAPSAGIRRHDAQRVPLVVGQVHGKKSAGGLVHSASREESSCESSVAARIEKAEFAHTHHQFCS